MKDKLLIDKRLDIRNNQILKNFIYQVKPDFIFNLAAQSLVSKSYQDPSETIITNAIGTLNILESIKNLKHKIVLVLITSDKCYENVETFFFI